MIRPLNGGDVHEVLSLAVNQALVADSRVGWKLVRNMPGTIQGVIDLRALTSKENRGEAQSLVRGGLRELLADREAGFDVIVNVVLMIVGLGNAMILNT
jgi:hypothetical protein